MLDAIFDKFCDFTDRYEFLSNLQDAMNAINNCTRYTEFHTF